MEKSKKLTPLDLAFGIGRKATDEELQELLSRPRKGERKDGMTALEEIKIRLAKSNTDLTTFQKLSNLTKRL